MTLFLLTSCTLPNDLFTSTVTLTFDEMGGTEIDDLEVDQNTTIIPSEVPTKEGYVFDGWYLDEDYLYEASFTAGIHSNLTVYAKWVEEGSIYTLDDVRAIIDNILSEDTLTIADQTTIEGIVTDILTSDDYIDEQSIIDLVLEEIDVMEIFNTHTANMLAEAAQSVVYIETSTFGSVASGSGVIFLHTGSYYYVLTNYHVVEGYNQFDIVIFDGQREVNISRFYVDLIETSQTHDLAVLRFIADGDYPTMPLGDVDEIEVGQLVYSIGSPLDLLNTSTMGMISAINRPMTYVDETSNTNTTTIQHDAAISPGNSGGALVNIYGELIGVNFLSYVDDTVGEGVEGLHFAIQIDIVKDQLAAWDLLP